MERPGPVSHHPLCAPRATYTHCYCDCCSADWCTVRAWGWTCISAIRAQVPGLTVPWPQPLACTDHWLAVARLLDRPVWVVQTLICLRGAEVSYWQINYLCSVKYRHSSFGYTNTLIRVLYLWSWQQELSLRTVKVTLPKSSVSLSQKRKPDLDQVRLINNWFQSTISSCGFVRKIRTRSGPDRWMP